MPRVNAWTRLSEQDDTDAPSANNAVLGFGAFLLLLELCTHDLNAIAESIVQTPEASVSAIVCASANVPKEGLLRTLSGQLDVAIKKSKESVQDLWVKLKANANADADVCDELKSLPARSLSEPELRVSPSSPFAARIPRSSSSLRII